MFSLLLSITILTWNTARFGNFQKPAENEVLRYLVSQDADVVCLQEVDVYKDDRYLTLADVRQAMRAKYPYSYLDFAIYDKRHQFGTMIFSKYPLINKKSIHYRTKGNISNRCDIVVGADTIRLINNHLESYSFEHSDFAEIEKNRNYDGLIATLKRLKAKWSRAVPLRNEQARVVRQEIDASPYRTVVVGDFNATPLSYAYWEISKGMHDAWRSVHPWSWGATCEHLGFGVRIDYILSSETLVPVRCEIPEVSGSDHKPVVAVLAW